MVHRCNSAQRRDDLLNSIRLHSSWRLWCADLFHGLLQAKFTEATSRRLSVYENRGSCDECCNEARTRGCATGARDWCSDATDGSNFLNSRQRTGDKGRAGSVRSRELKGNRHDWSHGVRSPCHSLQGARGDSESAARGSRLFAGLAHHWGGVAITPPRPHKQATTQPVAIVESEARLTAARSPRVAPALSGHCDSGAAVGRRCAQRRLLP